MTQAIRKHLRDFIAVAVLVDRGAGGVATSSSRTSACASRSSRRSRSSSRPSSRPPRRSSPARARRCASRACGSATSVGRGRERQGGRDVRRRPQVPADLQRRDDPDAADDRPQGHVLRARPGHAGGRRARGGRRRCRSPTPRPTSTSTRSSRRLDADTQAYLRLLLVGAGKGLEGRGRDLGQVLGSLGPINRGPREAQLEGRAAQGQPRAADPQPQPADRGGRPLRGRPRRSSSTPRTRRSARSRAGPGRRSRRSTCSARRSPRPHQTLGPGQPTTRRVLGPTFNDLRPFAQNLDEMNASVRRSWPRHDAGAPATRSGRSCARRATRSRTCARPSKPLAQGDAEPDDGRRRRSTRSATWRPTTRSGAEPPGAAGPRRGLPLLGRLARPQRQQHLLRPATRTALYRRIYLTASCAEHRRSSPTRPAGARSSRIDRLRPAVRTRRALQTSEVSG